ncbi:FAGR243Wp [Eremothecium gossypii FDAG1]|nr:FAGR243Wp [Eremothecium gossypii FDAG1]
MSQSVGFEWGFKAGGEGRPRAQGDGAGCAGATAAANSQHGCGHLVHMSYKVGKPKMKRRLTNEEHGGARRAKRQPAQFNVIQGQPLPVHRKIEMMDKAALQLTLLQLVAMHPEVQDSLSVLQPTSPDPAKYTELLEQKMQAVYDHIPYSKSSDMLNDYAFVRMKAAILEFLNCLIDCLLDAIPPRTTNLLQSFKFLAYGTRLLAQMPHFETESNNYYKNICYEQVSEIWNTLIRHASSDINFLSTKPSLLHYLHELKQFNEQTKGKFDIPLRLFYTIMDDYHTQTVPAAAAVASTSATVAEELNGNSKSMETLGIWNNVA